MVAHAGQVWPEDPVYFPDYTNPRCCFYRWSSQFKSSNHKPDPKNEPKVKQNLSS